MVNIQMHASVSSLPCYRPLQQSADECNAAAWSFIRNMTACRGLCCQVIVGMEDRSCFLEKTELGILRLARRSGIAHVWRRMETAHEFNGLDMAHLLLRQRVSCSDDWQPQAQHWDA